MVDDDILYNLPPDPESAFLELERVARLELERTRDEQHWFAERRFVTLFRAFHDAYSPEFMTIPNRSLDNLGEWFWEFSNDIEMAAITIKMKRAIEASRGAGPSLRLPPDVRETLQFHLEQMLRVLRETELPDDKRDAIVRKLFALAKEIETSRTELRSWLDVGIEIADAAKEIGDKINPLREVWDKLLRRLGKAKEEAAQLPAPEKQKQIEGPKAGDECETPEEAFAEDDIPF